MSATQLNAAETLLVGGQSIFTNYIVESCNNPDFNVNLEDVRDENNVVVQRLVFQRAPRITAELLAKNGAAPGTDFPIGGTCTLSGWTQYVVNSCITKKVAGVTRVSIDIEAIFTNTPA